MNTKRLAVTATGIMLAAFALGATAAPGNMDNHPNKVGHEQRATNPLMQDKGNPNSANEGQGKDNSRDNENSNRQSDPDSTRGLERAEERHAEKADEHARPEKERHWYDALFGEDGDKDKGKDMVKKEPRWWWPFN